MKKTIMMTMLIALMAASALAGGCPSQQMPLGGQPSGGGTIRR